MDLRHSRHSQRCFSLFVQFWSSGVRERQAEWRAATLELERGKAKAELAKANADIASANAEIAETNKQKAGLEKDAAEARRDLAAANARATEADQTAEAERLERLKPELQTGPQDLAGQSRSELVAPLRFSSGIHLLRKMGRSAATSPV